MTRSRVFAALLLAACGSASTPEARVPEAEDDHPGARLAAGHGHSCVVTSGEVLCWGSNDRGQLGNGSERSHSRPSAIPALRDVVEVAAGEAHSCALTRDGAVWCWGAGLRGQIGDGGEGEEHQRVAVPTRVEGIDDAARIAAGGYHACAVRAGGRVTCWGDDAAGQLGDGEPGDRSAVPVELALEGVQALAAGERHTCALGQDGAVQCWGMNERGQLGTGDEEASALPTEVATEARFVELAAGRAHTCGRTDAGEVYCWGDNTRGQLGLGGRDVDHAASPERVLDVTDAVSLASGADHACVREASGEIACWGANHRGQLGDGTLADAMRPVPSSVSGVEIAGGVEHTCVRHEWGAVVCFGDNMHGQLGDGRIAWRHTPSLAVGVEGVTGLAVGGHHSCAVSESALICWGSNHEGQLGEVHERDVSAPLAAVFARAPQEASLALGRTCLRDGEGLVICAGHGVEPPARRATVQLSALGTIRQVETARDFACAMNEEGAIGCWGDNSHGQLGDGTLESRDAPSEVQGAADAREIAVGVTHACARLLSGAVYCWGDNTAGQLGDGTFEDRTVPTEVEGIEDAEQLALGRSHTCARRRDGTVMCWGANAAGQLGDQTASRRPTPGPVPGLEGVAGIDAGWVHTCVRTESGQVHCWGENRNGQLGRATERIVASAPAPVANLSGVEEIATGGLHTCARIEGGRVACWGANQHGQLGDGVTLLATRPVIAMLPDHGPRGVAF